MIGEGVLVAAIAAGAALAGSALSYWAALRLQQRQDARADALARAALRRDQRAACLGWVLEARTRMEALAPGLRDPESSPVSPDRSAAAAARQAYAVALLYLADVRPCAKAFYQSTVSAQLALEKPSADSAGRIGVLMDSWRESCDAMEQILADMQDLA